jgi:hypothetical protein
MSMTARSGTARCLLAEDTTEGTTAITTTRRFTPRAAAPRPKEATEEGHLWERAQAAAVEADMRLQAAAIDDCRTALNGNARNSRFI